MIFTFVGMTFEFVVALCHARSLQVFESTGGIWSVDLIEDALKKKFSSKDEVGICQFCCTGLVLKNLKDRDIQIVWKICMAACTVSSSIFSHMLHPTTNQINIQGGIKDALLLHGQACAIKGMAAWLKNGQLNEFRKSVVF